ncbi:putative C6 transcription factor [Aspergillus alliaceus]|uniref:putative C6 transcription factor n=1 Tax=Petromyces alliaceus TaxID=209559 RepID=UPI0012A64C54|nr:fungal-specific transcription factor domain-containing protein [Aspergillus alliaceus]KAB8227808.1 fungal-specific transcription factor domain-containing protein [Aspergillus alliaceus]
MDGGPDPRAPRRKRVSRACDRCRSKKDKCDGLRPACSACQASGQTCSYDPHAKKRGLPEGYVRGLEKLWALSICNIEGFEDTMLALLGTTTESTSRKDRLARLWADDGASETLHESWKTSRLYGALEKMLSNSDTPSLQGSEKRHQDDQDAPGNGWGFRIDRGPTPLSHDIPRAVEPSSPPRAKKARLTLPTYSQSPSPLATHSSPRLQLPPQTSQLLDVYFAVTHSWFPIIAKHNILRASYLYATAPVSVVQTDPGSADHAVLWALISYTTSQSWTNSQTESSQLVARTKEYYTIARNLIPSETGHYELGHVQALLLLVLVNIGLENWTAAWLLTGQAVRMAISIGLGTSADVRRSDELKQGKAAFLGCFVVDSLISFRMSRRPYMHPRDLAAVGLLEEDGLEEWNSWADVLPPTGAGQAKNPPRRGPLLTLSCFNRLVELASVVNKIAQDPGVRPNAHVFAQQLVLELKQWEDRLPLGCRLIGPESIYPERHSALLPHQTYLGLTYVSTLLWLYLHIAPHELGLHRSQRPATEGAKKLLYRALPMISEHLENFRICGLPPIFEFSLHTIAKQAFLFRNNLESGAFPFERWAEALRQRTVELSPSWPVYPSLATSIEQWCASKDLSAYASASFRRSRDNLPAPSKPTTSYTSDITTGYRSTSGETAMQRVSMNNSQILDHEYTSSTIGISIPVDGQYMTPKDMTMDNATDVSFQSQHQQMGEMTALPDKSDSLGNLDALLQPAHPHPPTPDSSISNNMMSGMNTTNDHSMPYAETINLNAGDPSIPERQISSSDLDSIFKDLAYLDTTEWATSREAGLKDFGFIDDSTFQAFCHDPDRLAYSQPLVHPPSIADIWPPPGFFPETFQDCSEDAMES